MTMENIRIPYPVHYGTTRISTNGNKRTLFHPQNTNNNSLSKHQYYNKYSWGKELNQDYDKDIATYSAK